MNQLATQLKRFVAHSNIKHDSNSETDERESPLRNYWPHELYVEVGINTLLQEHKGYRHLHRYYLWSDQAGFGFLRFDDESCLGYQMLQVYHSTWNQEVVELYFDVTVNKPKGIALRELLSETQLVPWRTRNWEDFLYDYQNSLIDELQSPNCRLQRKGQNIPNVRCFCFEVDTWVKRPGREQPLLAKLHWIA